MKNYSFNLPLFFIPTNGRNKMPSRDENHGTLWHEYTNEKSEEGFLESFFCFSNRFTTFAATNNCLTLNGFL